MIHDDTQQYTMIHADTHTHRQKHEHRHTDNTDRNINTDTHTHRHTQREIRTRKHADRQTVEHALHTIQHTAYSTHIMQLSIHNDAQ